MVCLSQPRAIVRTQKWGQRFILTHEIRNRLRAVWRFDLWGSAELNSYLPNLFTLGAFAPGSSMRHAGPQPEGRPTQKAVDTSWNNLF